MKKKILFFMLLVFACILQAKAQERLLSITVSNLPIEQVFETIKAKSGYTFLYNSKQLEGLAKVSLNVKNVSIEKVLDTLFAGTGLTYNLNNNTIVVIKEQTRPIKTTNKERVSVVGVVTDGTKSPLEGAVAYLKKNGQGVETNEKGEFTLLVPREFLNDTLCISFIGLEPVERALNLEKVATDGSIRLVAQLKENTNELDQIVVVGYGVSKKKDLAGSIETVSLKELAKANTANFQKAIQGKMSGVQVVSSSGVPGASFSINIRGRGSINADTQPLYIIDGVQLTSGAQKTNILTDADVMAGLNPDDIESITVLKDGASASIYGAQAANGVVIITTKKGAAGKTNISFNATVGVQEIARKVPVMNGKQWAEYALLEYKNYDKYNGTSRYAEHLKLFKEFGWGDDGYSAAPTTDWYDEIFRQAVVQNYQVNVSGGTEKTKIYLSGGYNNTDGIIKHTGFTRVSARLNVSHQLFPWLTINSNNSFSKTKHNQASNVGASNPSRTAMFLLPGLSPRDKDGNYISDLPYGYYLYNIPQMLELNEFEGKTSNLLSSNDLTFKIIKGLEFKSSYNFDLTWIKEHQFSDPRTRLGSRVNGAILANSSDITKFQTEQVFSYNLDFKNSRLNALAGFSYSDYQYSMIGAEANGVSHPDLQLLSSAAKPISTTEEYSQWKMAGFFARLTYTLKERYIFTGTIRHDGSSRFGKGNLWGTFPSISFAWRMKEESFLKDIKWLNDLKIRASYGVTGNANIGDYVSSRLYGANNGYDGSAGVSPTSIGNYKLSWEKKHSKNIGITAGFFDGRISTSIDLYMDDTKDLLYDRVIPQTSGFSIIPSNMGGVRNKGLDVQLNTINFDGGFFKWETAINISLLDNKITELQDGLQELGQYKVGKSITANYVYKWAGVNTSDGRPMYYDKDGYITYNPSLEDRYWIKGSDPTFFGGMDNSFTIGNFNISFFIQFQRGAVKYWSDKTVLIGQAADNNLLVDIYDHYWKKPGDVTWVPQPVIDGAYPGNPLNYDSNSDPGISLIYESTDFIKLKNVNVSYNLPTKIAKKLRISNAQIFVNAYNLLTSTPYRGYDPESVGNDRGIYPQSKSYSLGIKVNF